MARGTAGAGTVASVIGATRARRIAARTGAALLVLVLVAPPAFAEEGPALAADRAAPPASADLPPSADALPSVDAPPTPAEDPAPDDTADRVDKLESKVDVIAEELSRAITAATVPEESPLMSYSGLGPAASKVYYRDKGLSIGGYGEVLLETWVTDQNDGAGGKVSRNDVFDALRAVLYVGYKFNDRWLVNSEIEFEHASTSENGSVSVEFLTLDYMPRDWLNFRVGLVLIPMGFINEVHEPVFFYGAARPAVERQIIPTTWRENGGGVFGSIGSRIRYRMYAVNGFNATGFSVSGLRNGRQDGSQALVNDWAFVGRFDVDVIDDLVIGGSVYTGKSGQQQQRVCVGCGVGAGLAPVPGTLTTLYEVHAEYQRGGLTIQALLTQAFLEDTALLNFILGNTPTGGRAIARQMLGWYAVGAYDVLPLIFKDTEASLEPYFRYERLDTQNEMAAGFMRNQAFIQDIYTVGLQFEPISRLVFKVDYQNVRPESDPDDVADAVRFAVGYVF